MKPFKKIILVVLLIPILLVIGSLFLPAHYRVERDVSIQAPPEVVFGYIGSLPQWTNWTAWTTTRYPDMKVSFAGPPTGAGATYSWDGKTSGQGTLKITRSDPPHSLAYELAFDHGKFISTGGFQLESSGDAVNVSWFNEGDLGWNPVSRVFGLFMDKMMGPDFEEGLLNLQRLCEKKSESN